MWHASIALVKSQIVSTDRWGDGTKRVARRIAMDVLDGVGTGESIEVWTPTCVHLRRGLSESEIAMLSAEWLAIPAVDGVAPGGGIETRL